ncbi:MAG: TRAP transporter small permease [Sulfuritalea sp.]|nr:TRAP transporter small permease [Sulfuritalea sp.]
MSGGSMNPGDPLMGRWERPFEMALGSLTALALASIMLLTCLDVAGRYLFNQPVPGALEVTELMMGALIFTSLPLVTLRQQQVTVDIFESFIPRIVKPFLHWLTHAVGCVCLAAISWRLWVKAGQMLGGGDITAVLQVKVWPLVYYMSLQAAITTLVLFLILLRQGQADKTVES